MIQEVHTTYTTLQEIENGTVLSGNNGGEVYVASPSERRASRQHRVSRSNLGHTPDQAALAASALRLLGKVFCYHKVMLYLRRNTVTMVGMK